MKSFLILILAAVLALGTAFPISASEPDRITQSLTIDGYSVRDEPYAVGTGTIEVRLSTSLLCAPPDGKVGCGVLVGMILHAPVTGDYPTYEDVIDAIAVFECGEQFAPACQAGPGSSSRVFTFAVPRPGTYVLEVWSVVGFDYNPEDLRLTSDFPVLDEGAVYDEGSIYTVRGGSLIVVSEAHAA